MSKQQKKLPLLVIFIAGLVVGSAVLTFLPALADTATCTCPTNSADATAVTNAGTADETSATETGTASTGTADATTDAATSDSTAAAANVDSSADVNANTTSTSTETPADPEPEPLPHLVLNEILPDPVGTDTAGEFIEIANLDTGDADLSGWQIANQSGKVFNLPSEALPAGAVRQFIYAETKITLVNSGGSIRLVSPAGDTISSATYGTAPTGKSWARSASGTWDWNNIPTQGMANDEAGFPQPEVTVETVVTTATTTTDTDANESATSASTATTADTLTSDAATDQTAEASTEQTPTAAPDVIVTEALPRPGSDDEERIELWNRGATAATLDGWTLDDAEGGSKPFALAGATIPANDFLIIAKSQSKLALNDDGDEVRLISPASVIVSATAYKKAPVGQAWALVGDVWQWAEPTPGAANPAPAIIPEAAAPQENAPAPTDGQPTAEQINPLIVIPVAGQTSAAAKGGEVALEGVVTLPPGKVGSNTFAVASGGRGIFVRAYGAGLPLIKKGETVVLTGKITDGDGATSMSVTSREVRIIGAAQDVTPAVKKVGELVRGDHGLLVALSGTVTATGKKWLTLGDENLDGGVTVTLLSGSMPDGKHEGKIATAIGVVRFKGEQAEILIEGDALTLADAPASGGGSASGTAAAEDSRGKSSKLPAIVTPLGGVAASAYAVWRKRRGLPLPPIS
jgi:hypothetical protein